MLSVEACLKCSVQELGAGLISAVNSCSQQGLISVRSAMAKTTQAINTRH